jgi:bacterioferritin-associated ferredoxin
MYVCVCNAVTERDIGRAVSEGCCTLKHLRAQTGVGSCCGRCTPCARQVMNQALHSTVPLHSQPLQLAAA